MPKRLRLADTALPDCIAGTDNSWDVCRDFTMLEFKSYLIPMVWEFIKFTFYNNECIQSNISIKEKHGSVKAYKARILFDVVDLCYLRKLVNSLS